MKAAASFMCGVQILLVLCCAGAASGNSEAVGFVKRLHFRDLDQYGVQHYQILGQDQNWGILHIIAKVVRLTDKVVFWGTGLFEPVEGGQYYLNPETFAANMPELTLQSPLTWDCYTLNVTVSQVDPSLPFLLRAELQDESPFFALKVGNWSRWVYVRPRYPPELVTPVPDRIAGLPVYTTEPHKQHFPRSQAPVIGILKPMHIRKQFHLEEWPAMVAFHVRYHLRLGYSRFIMFIRPSLEEAMANNDHIRDLVQRQRLRFIRWNELPQHRDHYSFDQNLLSSAATVLLWGHNVWLNQLDTDEFIASDHRITSVREVLHSCASEASDLIRLNRLQLDCPACRTDWEEGESGDIVYWRKRKVPDPLKLYTRAGPFDMEDCRECKLFVDPNNAYALSPHRADLLEDLRPEVIVNTSCAYIAHLVNLVHIRRDGDEEYYQRENNWWWLHEEVMLSY